VWDSPGFLQGTLRVAWVWVAAFAVMTISSLITVFRPNWETWTTWAIPIVTFVAAVLYTRAVETRGAARAAAASKT
jgi:hypothetical protein